MKNISIILLFFSSLVFLISFIAIIFAIICSLITKKYKGLLWWLRFLVLSFLGIVIAWIFDPYPPTFMGERSPDFPPFETVIAFGDLLIYSLVLILPIEFFDIKKRRKIAYITLLFGFCWSILSPIVYRDRLLPSSFDVGSLIIHLSKLLFVPTVFLYILHLRKISTKGTEIFKKTDDEGAKEPPTEMDQPFNN